MVCNQWFFWASQYVALMSFHCNCICSLHLNRFYGDEYMVINNFWHYADNEYLCHTSWSLERGIWVTSYSMAFSLYFPGPFNISCISCVHGSWTVIGSHTVLWHHFIAYMETVDAVHKPIIRLFSPLIWVMTFWHFQDCLKTIAASTLPWDDTIELIENGKT